MSAMLLNRLQSGIRTAARMPASHRALLSFATVATAHNVGLLGGLGVSFYSQQQQAKRAVDRSRLVARSHGGSHQAVLMANETDEPVVRVDSNDMILRVLEHPTSSAMENAAATRGGGGGGSTDEMAAATAASFHRDMAAVEARAGAMLGGRIPTDADAAQFRSARAVTQLLHDKSISPERLVDGVVGMRAVEAQDLTLALNNVVRYALFAREEFGLAARLVAALNSKGVGIMDDIAQRLLRWHAGDGDSDSALALWRIMMSVESRRAMEWRKPQLERTVVRDLALSCAHAGRAEDVRQLVQGIYAVYPEDPIFSHVFAAAADLPLAVLAMPATLDLLVDLADIQLRQPRKYASRVVHSFALVPVLTGLQAVRNMERARSLSLRRGGAGGADGGGAGEGESGSLATAADALVRALHGGGAASGGAYGSPATRPDSVYPRVASLAQDMARGGGRGADAADATLDKARTHVARAMDLSLEQLRACSGMAATTKVSVYSAQWSLDQVFYDCLLQHIGALFTDRTLGGQWAAGGLGTESTFARMRGTLIELLWRSIGMNRENYAAAETTLFNAFLAYREYNRVDPRSLYLPFQLRAGAAVADGGRSRAMTGLQDEALDYAGSGGDGPGGDSVGGLGDVGEVEEARKHAMTTNVATRDAYQRPYGVQENELTNTFPLAEELTVVAERVVPELLSPRVVSLAMEMLAKQSAASAVAFVERLDAETVRGVDNHAFAVLLHVLGKRAPGDFPAYLTRLLATWKRCEYVVDARMNEVLLSQLVKAGRVADAQRVVEVLQARGPRPTLHMYTALLLGLVQQGRMLDAYDVIKRVHADRTLTPTHEWFRAMLEYYTVDGNFDGVQQVFQWVKGELRAGRTKERNRHFKVSWQQLDQFVRACFRLDTYSTLPDRAPDAPVADTVGAAMDAMEYFKEHGVTPSAHTLRMLLCMLAARGDCERAERVFEQDYPRFRAVPFFKDTFAVAQSFAVAGRMDRARAYFDRIEFTEEAYGGRTDVVVAHHNYMLYYYGQAGQRDEALALFVDMVGSRGISPTHTTISVLTEVCRFSHEDLDDALAKAGLAGGIAVAQQQQLPMQLQHQRRQQQQQQQQKQRTAASAARRSRADAHVARGARLSALSTTKLDDVWATPAPPMDGHVGDELLAGAAAAAVGDAGQGAASSPEGYEGDEEATGTGSTGHGTARTATDSLLARVRHGLSGGEGDLSSASQMLERISESAIEVPR